MADLLPSTPDLSGADEAEPRVVGVDSDEADDMLSALSSDTARTVLSTLHEEPDTASGLADRVETSLQNVQYHLGNLSEAGLVDVVDTVYSEKGREMKVYAPADRPLVVFAGREEDSWGLKEALSRLLGAVGVLALVSLAVQFYLQGLPTVFQSQAAAGGDGGGTQAGTMSVESAPAAAAATGLPPGLLFFLGGALMLAVAAGVWYWRRR